MQIGTLNIEKGGSIGGFFTHAQDITSATAMANQLAAILKFGELRLTQTVKASEKDVMIEARDGGIIQLYNGDRLVFRPIVISPIPQGVIERKTGSDPDGTKY